MFVIEKWCEASQSWIAMASFTTKQEARARLWELRLRAGRVREVSVIESR